MATPLSGSLRIITSLVIVIGVGLCGYWGRSPWIIVLLTPLMTVLYAAGKWSSWKLAYRQGGVRPIILGLLATLPVQAIVTGLFYLLGLGLAAAFGSAETVGQLERFDWIYSAVFGIAALLPAFIINILERHDTSLADFDMAMKGFASPEREPEYDFTIVPVTIETFFNFDFETRGPAIEPYQTAARATEAEIEETEARLGVALPARLKQLYRMHNGGHTGGMAVAAVPDPVPGFDDYRMVFAHDYDWLLPLEKLMFYYDDAVANWADPDDPDDMEQLPPNAKGLLVLAQRYADTTYLDYSQPGEPKAGVRDFESYSEEAVEFESFDAFFAALRHFDTE